MDINGFKTVVTRLWVRRPPTLEEDKPMAGTADGGSDITAVRTVRRNMPAERRERGMFQD